MSSGERPADSSITRRDFVGGALAVVGGSGLRHAQAQQQPASLDDRWTGPGGIGDYRDANGNTAKTVNAAHGVRDGAYASLATQPVSDTGELYDLVVVGGGVAGMSAAYTLFTKHSGGKRCLVLENHEMFGGESRGNQVEIDGYRVSGPQGANQTGPWNTGFPGELHRALGLPKEFEFAEATGTRQPLAYANDHFDLVFKKQKLATTGYWMGPKAGWVREAWQHRLKDVPWPEAYKANLLSWFDDRTLYRSPGGVGIDEPHSVGLGEDPVLDTPLNRWLDSMTYAEFIRDVMKLDSIGVARYADPYLSNTLGGPVDAVSAYGARIMEMPGVAPAEWRFKPPQDVLFSFPLGNAIYPRYMVRAMIPSAYADSSLETMVYGITRRDELDKPQNNTRVRLSSTVVRVEHDGNPQDAKTVSVIYSRGGRLEKVRARGVVMACGSWIHRRVVADMPDEVREAAYTFVYAPILVANVAVRHWRYFDQLGITAARWFEGFGFSTNLRKPMRVDGKAEPFSPDKPTMLTMYKAFSHPGLPGPVQGSLARQELFSTPFAEYERQIRAQLQEMFGAHGFDARRDIGGVILNRWGHAFAVPQPGFYFGRNGKPAARALLRAGYGRIAFGCADMQGYQTWVAAYLEGQRAALQVGA